MTENLAKILETPVFVERCNEFVDIVETKIAPKYEGLGFEVYNKTEKTAEEINKRFRAINEEVKPEEREEWAEDLTQRSIQNDKTSAYMNVAEVRIWGEREKDIERIKKALEEVKKAAWELSGSRDSEVREGLFNKERPKVLARFIFLWELEDRN